MAKSAFVSSFQPLASILRPTTLDEIIGQQHLVCAGMPLRKMLEKSKFQNTILWGPSGVGKTSIVNALALESKSRFVRLNATEATVKDLRKTIEEAEKAQPDQKTMVFVDEAHRFTKGQQDVLLPHIECGTLILFGATTEQPKFAINSTILSRCVVFEVRPLDQQASLKLIMRVKDHYKRSDRQLRIAPDAALQLVNRASGDARKIVTVLELAFEVLSDDGLVTVEHIDVAIPHKHLMFDKSGNEHYDLAHCYQEAIQNSDVNGAIYWLAKWVESGEDPAFICRRMLITAFEDCAGNPFASLTAMAASYTTERVGLPECLIPMAQATCEMACSKRNKASYYAIQEAVSDVRNNATIHVPDGLRAGTSGYIFAIAKKYVEGWKRD